MKAILKMIQLDALSPNPHRNLVTYPFLAHKIEALQRSIADVGFWEGVIARPADNGFELAFGHHRVEAARQSGLEFVPIIVRDLTDEQMLKFMGRENGEDYNSNFLVMLETWDAAVRHLESTDSKITKPIDIAGFLGWNTNRGDGRTRMNPTAAACSAAHNLIAEGHIKQKSLTGLAVGSARELCTSAQQQLKSISTSAARNKTAAPVVKAQKKAVADAVTSVAKQTAGGAVPVAAIRATVQTKTATNKSMNPLTASPSTPSKKSPLDKQIIGVSNTLDALIATDGVRSKLDALATVINDTSVTLSVLDKDAVDKVRSALVRLSKRALAYDKKLTVNKVVDLKGVSK